MGSLGGSSFTADTSTSDATASLMRDQYADYVSRYVPLEDELINMISEPINPQATAMDVADIGVEDTSRPPPPSGFRGSLKFGGGFGDRPEDGNYNYRPQPTEPVEYGEARKLGNTALTNEYIGDAREISSDQMSGAADIMKRNAARRGLRFTGDKGDVFDRSRNLGTALMDVDVANKTRDSIDDFNVRTATELMNTGRGLAGDASSMYMSASQLEANRNATNRSLAAQEDASLMSGLGTAAGIAATFI